MDTSLPDLVRDAVFLQEALPQLVLLLEADNRSLSSRYGLSGTQVHALRVLSSAGPMNVKQMAACLHLEKSTVSRLVDSLTSGNLARKRPDSRDSRVVMIQPTEKGLRLTRRIIDNATRECLQLLQTLPVDTRIQVAPGLRGLLDALSEASTPVFV